MVKAASDYVSQITKACVGYPRTLFPLNLKVPESILAVEVLNVILSIIYVRIMDVRT